MEWVLEQVGKATIWQTSFSISEEFLRRLFFIEKLGKVDTIHLILDFKATQKTLWLWPFLTRVIEHTYSPCCASAPASRLTLLPEENRPPTLAFAEITATM